MSAAVTLTQAPRAGTTVTVTGTGFTAGTAYVLTIVGPTGTIQRTVTSDGSGNFTDTFVANANFGTYTCSVRPQTEHKGTTSASATPTTSPVP